MQSKSYALFIDNSGSVSGSQNYWTTVQRVITDYAKDITQYFLWNSNCYPSSLKQIEENIKTRKSMGGTSPHNVANVIVAKKMSRIILITDGEVGNNDVEQCDKIFETAKDKQKFTLSKSICYIVNTGSGVLNMSVTCPFTRFCQNIVYIKNKNEDLKTQAKYTKQDYKILDSLQQITLSNFEQKYDLIQGLIIAINMGKQGNIPLKNQLVSMKNRLVKQLSMQKKKQFDYGAQIRINLQKGNIEQALKLSAQMSKKYFSDDNTTSLQKKISHLINLCGDLRGKYNLNQIKSNKMDIATTAKQGKLDVQVQINDLSKNPIQCPIIMDQDIPQILIDQRQPFLLGVQKHIVDDIAACPLRILNYPQIKSKFKSCLSTFIGVKYADQMHKNPFTQNRLLGGIPLGTHKSHVQVGNHTIAKLIAGGKILGNLNMYYAVIWYLVNEDQIQYLKPIKANVTQHLLYRLKNSNTMASLCGLAQFVTTNVPTDVAIWYCVHSGYLNQPTDRDTFRFHVMNLKPMIKMVRALQYPLHEKTKIHYLRTKALLSLLSYYKKISTNQKKILINQFKALYQRGFFIQNSKVHEKVKQLQVCTSFIPVDGQPSAQQIEIAKKHLPKICQKIIQQIGINELYYISTLLDAQKSASDIFLDYNLKAPPVPKAQILWVYGVKTTDESDIQFCPKTLRPFYIIKNQTWQQIARQIWKVQKTSILFKGCKYLQNFILKYQKIPTVQQLAIFYYNRYIQSGKINTLPYLTQVWVAQLIQNFQKVASDKQMNKIIQILNKSRPIDTRIKIQKQKQ